MGMSTEKKERIPFDVEINSLMSIIINSVYTDKDIGVRELVSNASDALDKFVATYNNKEYSECDREDLSDLRINITVNKEDKTITIADNGIGMTADELRDFLGKIANSGTRQFKELL